MKAHRTTYHIEQRRDRQYMPELGEPVWRRHGIESGFYQAAYPQGFSPKKTSKRDALKLLEYCRTKWKKSEFRLVKIVTRKEVFLY